MHVLAVVYDLHIPGCQSLKDRRSMLRPVLSGVARRFGRNVYCHWALVHAEPVPGIRMQPAVQRLAGNERRALMSWLTRRGPFWDDLRRHDGNDWLECRGEIVTDTAVGEAAYRTQRGVACALISATPSDWDFSPVEVIWNREAEGLDDQNAALENWRDAAALEEWLQVELTRFSGRFMSWVSCSFLVLPQIH